MKNRRIVYFFISFLLFAILQSCSPSYKVIHINHSEPPSKYGGIYYALPKTILTVDVAITTKEFIKGPYANYAKKYLGLSNVTNSNYTISKISDIKISSYTEPDSSHFYLIENKNGFLCKNNSLFVGLSESGVIQYINEDNKEIADQKKAEYVNFLQTSSNESFIHYSGTNLTEKVDTIVEKITKDTITFEKQILKKTIVEKTLEQRASDAADFILKLNEARYNLISGLQEITYSKDVMEYMCENLEKLEKEYLELFTGYSKTNVKKYRFFYTPSHLSTSITVPLFKFSNKAGVLDVSDTTGQLIFLEIIKQGSTDALSNYIDTINKSENEKDKKKENGIFYRIPETARISLIANEDIIADAFIQVSQFGTTTNLPLKNLKVSFWPNSGAIRTINFIK